VWADLRPGDVDFESEFLIRFDKIVYFVTVREEDEGGRMVLLRTFHFVCAKPKREHVSVRLDRGFVECEQS
jgi:hypothetical protein